MKIIVTDGYVENPGDLSWAPLEALGEVTYYDRIGLTDEDETIRRIGDAEIAVINKAPVTRKVIDSCPNLKLITVMATGASIRRTNCRNSSWARLRTTPPPQISMGFLDSAIISTSFSTSSRSASGIFRLLV